MMKTGFSFSNMNKNISKYIFFVIIAVYIVFIAALSWLFPYGLDEYFIKGFPLKKSFMASVAIFWFYSPKIGVFIAGALVFFGKWLFVLLNPFVQLAITFAMFYFVHLRLPDFKNYKDMPAFLFLLLCGIFAVTSPAETVFWQGGAANYSWVFLVFISYLCCLRAFYAGKPLFEDSWLKAALFLLFGFGVGLTNENNAPMALCLMAAFLVLCLWKGRKIPKWFYGGLAGCVAGVFLMFYAPALSGRMGSSGGVFGDFTLGQKLFFHINHLDYFIRNNLLLPVLGPLALFICGMDSAKKPFKNQNYLMALLCSAICWALAFVLFAAPDFWRSYYSASMFSILSFTFILIYILQTYKINLLKYAAIFITGFALTAGPLFAFTFIDLHCQAARRAAIIAHAKAQGKESVDLPLFIILKGPSANLSIRFYDAALASPAERKYYYKIAINPTPLLPEQIFNDGTEPAMII